MVSQMARLLNVDWTADVVRETVYPVADVFHLTVDKVLNSLVTLQESTQRGSAPKGTAVLKANSRRDSEF